MKTTAVLLLSGGLDSAANLVLGPAAGFEVRLALTVDYGQRGATREIESAQALCRHFGLAHRVLRFPGFRELAGAKGALLSSELEPPRPSDLDDLPEITRTAEKVWVPNRNGVLMGLAAALAEAQGLGAVAVGFNREEATTFPDNSKAYMQAFENGLGFSTANHVRVVSATVDFDKAEIVRKIAETKFPFELLWSCYRAGERHCGACESCLRLERALKASLSQDDQARAVPALFGTRGSAC